MTRFAWFVLAAGAFVGAMVGAMFDSVRTPGQIVAAGAGFGAVFGLLALLQLRRCDPYGLFKS